MPSPIVQSRCHTLRNSILTGAVAALSLVVCRESAAEETNVSAVATQRWQEAKEGASNVWGKVKDGSVEAWGKVEEGSSNAWHTVKHGTTQAWDNVRSRFDSSTSNTNYVYQQKDKFVANASAELGDLDQKIKQYSDKTAEAGGSARDEAQKRLQSIKEQRGYLEQKYNEAKEATEKQWNKAQPEFQKAYDQTRESLKSAWDWLKEKTSG